MIITVKKREFEIEGTISESNREEIEVLLINYDWHTVYISDSGQRAEAEDSNWKLRKELKELGINNFKRVTNG